MIDSLVARQFRYSLKFFFNRTLTKRLATPFTHQIFALALALPGDETDLCLYLLKS